MGDLYEVPFSNPDAGGQEVKLTLQVRDTNSLDVKSANKPTGEETQDADVEPSTPASPSRKLQTALMMRSYLDNHDVLRQMQELLQDMVTNRPEDPTEYMIRRLEDVCQDSQGVELDNVELKDP